MGFSRQEYWGGFLHQGIFLTPESYLCLLPWQALSLSARYLGSPRKLLKAPKSVKLDWGVNLGRGLFFLRFARSRKISRVLEYETVLPLTQIRAAVLKST